MGKNGGKLNDTILTLEEALTRFKRRRETGELSAGEGLSESGIQLVELAPVAAQESRGTAELDLETAMAMASASASAQRDEAAVGATPAGDVVAVIEGIPRTLEDLELMAAAEDAYKADFPDTDEDSDEADSDGANIDVAAIANRHALIRDYAFTAMGSALMVLVAFLMTRVPTISTQHNSMMAQAQSIETPAPLKASSLMSQDDLITTLVIVPDSVTQQASSAPTLATAQLEGRIKNTLKTRAFPDIGVSVSKKGDAYLAGEVYSLNEAKRIAQIVHEVDGVNRVHFLHPDVLPVSGPAYFGVMTASAPAIWGAKVKSVVIGSPADKAGLKQGDVISEFDGNTIPDSRYLDLLIAHYSPGQRVQIRVWHKGQPEYLVARLGELTTVASR